MFKPKNEYELIFKTILDELNINYVREYKFHAIRKHRFDFAIIHKKVAFEVDGGVWNKGRHTSPIGYMNDCIKQALAAEMGWRIIKIPTPWLKHNLYKKPQNYLMTYEDVVELVENLTAGTQ